MNPAPWPESATPSATATATAWPTSTLATASSAALAACGGGGSSSDTPAPPSPTPPPPVVGITRAEAARFLGQASFAASDTEIVALQSLGYSAWLDAQFAMPRSSSHFDWLLANGYGDVANINNFSGTDNTLWRKLITSPDLLRQRVALALSEIFVVSMTGLPIAWRSFVTGAYMDVLEANAFGSYRSLLEAVTLSPAMGVYLNLRGNQKEDPKTGREPDENYAREVLQLFSIGLVELAADGTPRGGVATDTYAQDTVTGLAHVFTGWDFDRLSRAEPGYAQRPMVFNPALHSGLAAQFLGTTVAAGSDGKLALKAALDAIANHANVGPFIGRQLIQRLVTSNPGADYVGRVAAAFNDNGAGQRGDLKAVLKAVLLDPQARSAPGAADTTRGKLREPVQRFVQWARTFGLTSPTGLWNIGNLSDPATRLGQSPLRAPSVFNFFRPGYVPPNSALGQARITAPEFQITNESSVVGWANFLQGLVARGAGETRPDYAAELALASDGRALVARLSTLLTGDALSASTLATIATAISSISDATDAGKRNRVNAAIHLVMCSPEYLVQI